MEKLRQPQRIRLPWRHVSPHLETGKTMKQIFAILCVVGISLTTLSAYAADDKATLDARTSVKKGAFLVGAEYGQGVVTCRTGHGWSAPAFIRIAGGSFGFQIGGQATDLVLVAVNDKGFQDLLKNKFKIGGDASAAAGPVGRDSQAATDWKLNAELLTYSRAKGLFAGVDLTGAVVDENVDATRTFYGDPHPSAQILKGEVATPTDARPFVRTVAKYFSEVHN
jgi:lipid-binding SYLF domain-containing protein